MVNKNTYKYLLETKEGTKEQIESKDSSLTILKTYCFDKGLTLKSLKITLKKKKLKKKVVLEVVSS